MPAADSGGEFEDFTAYMAARREDRGCAPGFRLDGETFVCEPVLRAGALLDVTVRANEIGAIPAYIAFLEDQLLPEAWERFQPLLRDRTRPVDADLLEKLVEKIVSDYSGRPTQESPSSSTASSKSGRRGKGGSTPAGSLRSA